MITDDTILIDDTPEQELPLIAQMEQDEDSMCSGRRSRHTKDRDDPGSIGPSKSRSRDITESYYV